MLLHITISVNTCFLLKIVAGGIIAVFRLLSSPMFPYHNKVLEPLLR